MAVFFKNKFGYKFLSVFIILSAVAFIALILVNREEKPAEEKPVEFFAAAGAIDRYYKELKLAERGEAPEISGAIRKLNSALGGFTEVYGQNQPAELSATRDWDKKIIALNRNINKTAELLLENNPAGARAEVESAYGIYAVIKQENGMADRLSITLPLYEAGLAVSAAQTKEEAVLQLQSFKLLFTEIKKDNVDERYADLMKRTESAIMDIERLLPGPDFKRAQNDLAAISTELFFNY